MILVLIEIYEVIAKALNDEEVYRDLSDISTSSDEYSNGELSDEFLSDEESILDKKITINKDKKGMYWKLKCDDGVFWSDEIDNPKKTVSFTNQKMYFNHRVKNNFKRLVRY